MSISIVLIEKTGTCKDIKMKDFKKENLYKKCNFRKNDNFELRNNWKINKFGLENKYDLPPPIDNELYFGTMAVIGVDENDEVKDIEVKDWEKIYEHLFGGFEDLNNSSEESEDELANVPESQKTKSGYLKDSFIVEDEEEEDMLDLGSELSEEDYYFSEEE
jgi:hypothetical protein